MLKMNLFLLKSDFYLAEKTLNIIWKKNISRTRKYAALDTLMKFYFENKKQNLAHDYLKEAIEKCDDDTDRSRLELSLLECLLIDNKLEKAGKL